jgi:hypothetical protein
MAMAKGLTAAGTNEPQDVYRHFSGEDMHVPFDQIVYVGDGASDMPTSALMHQHGASPGRDQARRRPGRLEWVRTHVGGASGTEPGTGDVRRSSELLRSMLLCVESIARKVELRRLGRGE